MFRKSPAPTYYEILGVSEEASLIDIHFSYRRNPLLNSNRKLVQEAYDTLSDPTKRKQYDEKLKIEREKAKAKQSAKPAKDVPPAIPKEPVIKQSAKPAVSDLSVERKPEDILDQVARAIAAGKQRKRAFSEPEKINSAKPSSMETVITRETIEPTISERGLDIPPSDTEEVQSVMISSVLTIPTEAEEEPFFLLIVTNTEGQSKILQLPKSAIEEEYLDFLDPESLALLNNPVLPQEPVSFMILSDQPPIEESGPIEPLRGFFHPFYKDRRENLPVAVEARKMLDAVLRLHDQFYYQKTYFTCSMNLAMADDVENAYAEGERLTNARKHYHRANREAKLMMMVEKLLDTSKYQHLRSFYIAPMSTCAKPGGKGAVTEDITQSQLLSIREKLDQGHAVFCLTDEASWNAEKPLSTVEEKLSVKKGDEITFSPALNQLTQETLMGFQSDYPIPEAVLNGLREDKDLLDAVKGVGQMTVTMPPAPKEENEELKETFKLLYKALTDAHFLKTWPFSLNTQGVRSSYTPEAITTRQKREVIISAMKIIARRISHKKIKFPEDKATSEASLECKQLARKYAERIGEYISYHAIPSKDATDGDLSSEVNRVKLAMILLDSLRNVYSPKEEEDRFDTQDFFDIVDSAESYAVELQGTHSKLQTILNDMAWEARFLKKAQLSQEKVKKIPESSLINEDSEDLRYRNGRISQEPLVEPDPPSVINLDDLPSKPPLKDTSPKTFIDHPDFIRLFREAKDDAERVSLLKEHLAKEIDKTYAENGKKGMLDFNIRHTKDHTARRIKGIETNDLTQYSRMLIAEFRGQDSSSSSIKRALDKALDALNLLLPELSQSTLRFVALKNATQLLEYVNKRERSIAYKMGTFYARTFTFQHMRKAEELAYKMLKAETPEDLYKVILEASQYKTYMLQSLSKRQSEGEYNEANFDPNEKHSSLIPILDTIEKDFASVFRNQPSTERKPIDAIWQETFGGAYLDTKFKMIEKNKREAVRVSLKPEDELQKRCYYLAKEMQNTQDAQTKSYQEARMSALADAMWTSKYPQVSGSKVREQINVKDLERSRWQLPAVYYAQTCLAKLDEVNTERTTFKAFVEKALKPFLTPQQKPEDYDLAALHMTIKALEHEAKRQENRVARFFSPSRLRKFLEDFSRELEHVVPEVEKQARIMNYKGIKVHKNKSKH